LFRSWPCWAAFLSILRYDLSKTIRRFESVVNDSFFSAGILGRAGVSGRDIAGVTLSVGSA
jgi:hypothetical protein